MHSEENCKHLGLVQEVHDVDEEVECNGIGISLVTYFNADLKPLIYHEDKMAQITPDGRRLGYFKLCDFTESLDSTN